MITAADADASPEICARRGAFPSPDEVVNGVEADQSHDDQIDRHDEAQQPRHDQDQDAREEGDERRDVGNVVRVTRSIRKAVPPDQEALDGDDQDSARLVLKTRHEPSTVLIEMRLRAVAKSRTATKSGLHTRRCGAASSRQMSSAIGLTSSAEHINPDRGSRRLLLALVRHSKTADGLPLSAEERSCSGHHCNDGI
jgi:hypothetical protein